MSHRNHTRQRQQKNPAELPNMQAATCNYNRTVFAHLLAVTKKKNNLSQTALCALIMSTFGVGQGSRGLSHYGGHNAAPLPHYLRSHSQKWHY